MGLPVVRFNPKLVRGLPQIAPCLEHIFAGGGGGGNVAIEVFTCIGVNTDGIVLVHKILCYLCKLVVLE